MRWLKFLLISLLIHNFSFAALDCFILAELDSDSNKVLQQEGEGCDGRSSPASTFKIPLSLMGFDSGILINETSPKWPYKEEYKRLLRGSVLDSWRQPTDPTMWMKNSTIWYSQVLTQKLGLSKFENYVKTFKYGNEDISGESGKNNGLTRSWIGSSLKISPVEQIGFLKNLLHSELPISKKSMQFTRNILYVEDLPSGWKLYGKTGSTRQLSEDLQIGWFIGWVEKGDKTLVFATRIKGDNKGDAYTGRRAKEEMKKRFAQYIKRILN